VIGRYARTNASEFERRPVSVIECIGYVRMHSAKIYLFNFFFTKKIYTLKISTTNTQTHIYTHIYKHKHTSTPPPNLKRHIAHNVTELTKPRGWVNSCMA
jgi:hypothetical protein